MSDGSAHVVFGATGAIGGAVVAELVRRGHTVRAVSRGGQALDGVQGAAAAAAEPAQAAAVAAGAAVIYHCASTPYTKWPELFPRLTRSILHAAESSGAKLVFADNLYAYGPIEGPLREDLPALARGRKGRTRVEMAAEILDAQRQDRARVVIGRASDYYGPHGTGSTAGETLFGRIVAGKRPLWTGKLDQPHTFNYLPDIARGLIVLASRPDADGQVWHLPAAEPLTAQQFFDLVSTTAGRPTPTKASVVRPAVLALAGPLSPKLCELRETTYQFRAPFEPVRPRAADAWSHLSAAKLAGAVAGTADGAPATLPLTTIANPMAACLIARTLFSARPSESSSGARASQTVCEWWAQR